MSWYVASFRKQRMTRWLSSSKRIPEMGTGAERTEDSAKHLLGDLEAEMYGTHDPQESAQDGIPYEPPDRPVQEGTWSREQH